MTDDERPTTDEDRPTTDEDPVTTDDERPAADDGRPAADDERPTPDHGRPTTDDERPTPDDRPAERDAALVGRWSSAPFEYGVMECSELEFHADGRGSATVAHLAGDDVTRFRWHCPRPGLLELCDEDGATERRHYTLDPAAPAHTGQALFALVLDKSVHFAHQYAKQG